MRRVQGPAGSRVVFASEREGPYWAPGWEQGTVAALVPPFDFNEGSGAARRAAAIARGKAVAAAAVAAAAASPAAGAASAAVTPAGGGEDDDD